MGPDLFAAYRLRLKRQRLLLRSWRSRSQLTKVKDATSKIKKTDILAIVVLRNEAQRLPYFLSYYRQLGVSHFLVVDNASDDASAEILANQDDVSLWHTKQSYRASRFGLDWSTWLLRRFAQAHWCLTLDIDEVLIYPDHTEKDLHDLTHRLDQMGKTAFGAMLLDLYPKGPLSGVTYRPGQDPTEVLKWFDAAPYRSARQAPLGNLWVQGGLRERVFYADDPRRSPTLNKLPLVKWDRRFAYVNSTHSMLPPALNKAYDGPFGSDPSGVLLHTKFLPEIIPKSTLEKARAQHFHRPAEFDRYYDQISADPDLWHQDSVLYTGARQMRELGLIGHFDW